MKIRTVYKNLWVAAKAVLMGNLHYYMLILLERRHILNHYSNHQMKKLEEKQK